MDFGNNRIIGQPSVRQYLTNILDTGRHHHAYLFAGPQGVGKKALALAFAEALQGVSNLTDMGDRQTSNKPNWLGHPDIHMFIPRPTQLGATELQERIRMLAEDPYDIVDFSRRPHTGSEDDSKNRKAFYSVEYFSEEIRPLAYLKPHEGNLTIIILSNIETMRKEVANAFLKLLEEPPPQVMFLLTCDNPDQLLPTIISRCQLLRCPPLTREDIQQGLVQFDQADEDDASYLARISGGNYDNTRFYDLSSLREKREQIVQFLRYSYTQDSVEVTKLVKEWADNTNIEGMLGLCNLMETFLRDVLIYLNTGNDELVTNNDQLTVIRNFSERLRDARIEEMLNHLSLMRRLIHQNGNIKIILTTLSLRFSALMRGRDPAIPEDQPWKHTPAYQD